MQMLSILHYLHEPLHHGRVLVGEKGALLPVQSSDSSHVLSCQSKVKYVQIILHPLHVGGLWDDYYAPLEVPAQHYLSRCLSVLGTDPGERRVFKQTAPSLVEGCPGLHLDAVLVQPLFCCTLLEQKRGQLLERIRELEGAVRYIDWKQGFYDDVLSEKTPYVSNLLQN